MSDIPNVIPCYGVSKPGLTIEEMDREQIPLHDDHIAIDVTHCGICHSDIHRLTDEWSSINIKTFFPLSCGHELIGKVIAMGKDVTGFKIGDRVGGGPLRNSTCNKTKSETPCESCANGEENLCFYGVEPMYSPNIGGFGSQVRIPARFTYKIPDSIPSEYAGPLLCAGTTVYSPLRGVKPNSRVGIIGIGGLGHMAVQFAAAFGHEVTAISRSADKTDMVKSYGAVGLIDINDPEIIKKYTCYFDFILNTVAAPLTVEPILQILKPKGELCYVGLGNDNIIINPIKLVGTNKKVTGSYIAGSRETKEMLELAAEKRIFPTIEVVEAPFGTNSAEKVTQAVSKVVNNTVRFRMVLDYKKNL